MSIKTNILNETPIKSQTTSPLNEEETSLLDEYPVAMVMVFIPVYLFVSQVLHPLAVDLIK